MARSIFAAGGRPGHILHNAYGYGLFTGGLGAHYGAERLGCTVVPVSGGMTERQVTLINDFRPDVVMVTPSYMLAIVDEMERQGLDPRASSLRYGIFGAEPWTNQMRREVEERVGIDATDIYGLSEVMGPGVAQECVETKDGLHIWEDHFYPEIVDPLTGEVVPDGEPGELVLTSLTKQAMPVIRYRTRDLTRLLPGTARTMRRMEKITGRSDDMIILRGVNLFPTQIEELILRTPALSPHFQLHLSREWTARRSRRARRTATRRGHRGGHRGRRRAGRPGEEHHRRHRRRRRPRPGEHRTLDGKDAPGRRRSYALTGGRFPLRPRAVVRPAPRRCTARRPRDRAWRGSGCRRAR